MKNFHKQSHDKCIIPILVSTEAKDFTNTHSEHSDQIYNIQKANKYNLYNIISDIPISYIEGYGNILERATYLFPDCKIIFTANAHLYNDLFKVWCAERVNSGKKLIISDHGVTAIKYNNFSHEDKISDLHVVWHRAMNAIQVQMPPNILANRSTKRGSENNLAIIEVEFPLYVRQCASGTISSLTLDDYRQKIKFTRALDSNIREHIKIRIKSNYGKWNQNNNSDARIIWLNLPHIINSNQNYNIKAIGIHRN